MEIEGKQIDAKAFGDKSTGEGIPHVLYSAKPRPYLGLHPCGAVHNIRMDQCSCTCPRSSLASSISLALVCTSGREQVPAYYTTTSSVEERTLVVPLQFVCSWSSSRELCSSLTLSSTQSCKYRLFLTRSSYEDWQDPCRTTTLFESDPLLLAAREEPFWVACLITNIIFGYLSTKFRKIKEFLCLGFLVFSAGIVGLATLQPTRRPIL